MRRALTRVFSTLAFGLLVVVVALLVLIALAPRALGWQLVVVSGGSMSPTIPFGSVAVLETVSSEDLHAGDVVMYPSGNGKSMITHRILSISSVDGITTKGDANPTADIDPISASSVRGRYLFHVPWFGYFVHWMGTRNGYMSLVLVPGLVIIALEVVSIGKTLSRARSQKVPQ
jgi:signal peptidase